MKVREPIENIHEDGGKMEKNMGCITVKRENLFDSIEIGLQVAKILIDKLVEYDIEMPEVHEAIERAFASLELLRTESNERC